MSGVLLMSIGFLLASFGKSVLHLLLTQGFLAGMGMSLLYFPVLAPAPEYFTNHRATAMGFILAGAGAGGLLLSPLLRTLLTTLGGRWNLRIYALLNLFLGLPIAYSGPPGRFFLSSPSPSAPPESPNPRRTRTSPAPLRPAQHSSSPPSLPSST